MSKITLKTFRPALILNITGVLSTTVALVACSYSPIPNYYSLTTQVSPLTNSKVTVIELLPVGLPDRINRIPIVIQDMTGKSQILDNQRWTSTLATELRDNLSAGLQQKLGAVDRYSSGMGGEKISYRIATDFSRFDIIHSKHHTQDKLEVSVAWIVKRNSPTLASAQNETSSQQLACRMNFTQPILKSAHKQMQDIVMSANTALSHVVDAMALTVTSLDSQKIPNIDGVTCA